MRKLRVQVLLPEGHVPPRDGSPIEGRDADMVVANLELVEALESLGHEVSCIGLSDELAPVRRGIEEHRPHVVFNLILDFHGAPLYDAHVVSYLELLKQAYTGCNPRGILLASDKPLSKKILHYHRIRTAAFALCPRGRRVRVPSRLRYPLFVKSSVEHASLGISQASIVRDARELEERVTFVHEKVGTDAMVEEYIEGREFTVGVLGNQRLQNFPVWEMRFESLPEGTAPIATSHVKWNEAYQEKVGLETGLARGLDERTLAAIAHTARRVYRVLGMSGFARVDFRMNEAGEFFVLEANPNPDLDSHEDFVQSAAAAGLDYPTLLQRILNLGLRYRPGWKAGS